MNGAAPEHSVPARLLVVDDDPAIREVCVDLLSGEGYEVTSVSNGREAVDQLAAEPSDLVLMDLMMPELDGVTACKLIKANARTKNIPVIIMSAGDNLRARTRELQGIAAAIVSKPFDFDDLLLTVQQLIP
ncbi:MAG TPA: response regulator [Chloroflexia bacterium]|nr:response regulator [Chloroflexia bacterium]